MPQCHAVSSTPVMHRLMLSARLAPARSAEAPRHPCCDDVFGIVADFASLPNVRLDDRTIVSVELNIDCKPI